MNDEPEMTSADWLARRAILPRAEVDVAPELAPICRFDRDAHASRRRAFAEQMTRFLTSPVAPRLPADAILLALLPDDLVGAWFPEIEAAGSAVVATTVARRSRDGAVTEVPVVYLLTRSDEDVNEVVDGDGVTWCNVTASHRAEEAADAALFPCEFFWWSTERDLVGWRVEILWPREGPEPDDGGRVSLEGHDPAGVTRALLGASSAPSR